MGIASFYVGHHYFMSDIIVMRNIVIMSGMSGAIRVKAATPVSA